MPWETLTLSNWKTPCHRDESLREQPRNPLRHNVDITIARHDFVPEAVPTDATQSLYRPLQLGRTRILELLPAQYNDDIQCHLHTAMLEQNRLAYDALWYTW